MRAIKAALIAFILCALASPALAAWSFTFKASSQGAGVHSISVSSLTISAGHLILVGGHMRMNASTDTIIVTDSASDTFAVYQCPVAAANVANSFIAYAVTTGLISQSVTVADTLTGATDALGIVAAVTDASGGAATLPEDVTVRACAGSTSSTTSPSVTSGSPTKSGDGFFSVWGSPTTSTGLSYTEDTGNGWTELGGTGNTNIVAITSSVVNAGSGTIVHNPTTSSKSYGIMTAGFFISGSATPLQHQIMQSVP